MAVSHAPTTLAKAIAAIHRHALPSSRLWAHCAKQHAASQHLHAYVSCGLDAASPASAQQHGLLQGVPLAIKDNLCTRDAFPTTGASRTLRGFQAGYDATAVARLRRSGAVVTGKTNLDEFGMGSGTFHSAWGPSVNPWSSKEGPQLVPGGSSGGSAVAVAAHSAYAALGSDTGGSVRQPASYCGIVGLKPTYGAVSRHGLLSYASSLDTVGVLGRTVKDVALVYDVMHGGCEKDATSRPRPRPADDPYPVMRGVYGADDWEGLLDVCEEDEGGRSGRGHAHRPLRGMRIGIPDEFWTEEVPEDVVATWQQAADLCEVLGAEVVRVCLPSLATGASLAAYAVLSSAEASSNLARYDGVRYGHRSENVFSGSEEEGRADATAFHDLVTQSRGEGFGPEVQRRILLGTHCLSQGGYGAFYLAALEARQRLREEMQRCFDGRSLEGKSSGTVDALLTPTAPTAAFPIPSPEAPLPQYFDLMVNDIMTVPPSLCGIPAISIPAGLTSAPHTLPIGLQIIAPRFEEVALLRIAAALEGALEFKGLPPPAR